MTVSQPNGSIDGYTLPIVGRCRCMYNYDDVVIWKWLFMLLFYSSLTSIIAFFCFECHNDTRDFSLFDINRRSCERYVNIFLPFSSLMKSSSCDLCPDMHKTTWVVIYCIIDFESYNWDAQHRWKRNWCVHSYWLIFL